MSMAKLRHKRLIASLLLLVLGFLVFAAYARQYTVDKPHRAPGSKVIMTVRFSGGMCASDRGRPARTCPTVQHNLYDNGYFEGHTELAQSELAELIAKVNQLDTTRFKPKTRPDCASFSDGRDTSYSFPERQPGTFTPCLLDMPAESVRFFAYLDRLIQAHTKN